MKFGVVIFPGSNCDHDMIYVLKKIMNQEVVELWHKNTIPEGGRVLFMANENSETFNKMKTFFEQVKELPRFKLTVMEDQNSRKVFYYGTGAKQMFVF